MKLAIVYTDALRFKRKYMLYGKYMHQLAASCAD